jgi:hypothetical protein
LRRGAFAGRMIIHRCIGYRADGRWATPGGLLFTGLLCDTF